MSSDLPATDVRRRIAERWRQFAREAAGRSPAYVEICRAVADTPLVLDFLAAMICRP